jgi:prevent-host-death family protein
MTEVGVHEAKTHLSELLRRVMGGEEVVITRSGSPVAKLVPIAVGGKRNLGVDVGRFDVPRDFDAPLPEEVVATFET